MMQSNHRKQEKTSKKTTLVFAKNGRKGNAKTEWKTTKNPHPVFETKAWRAGNARLKNCDAAATSRYVPFANRTNCLQNEPQPRQNYP
jgi:hypothetical protein